MAQTAEDRIDRRDGLRRRIYLTCLLLGMPVLVAMWLVHRDTDPFIAIAYPLYALSQAYVTVGLLSRRLSVQNAERVVLVGTVITYLSALAFGLFTSDNLAELREQTTVSSLLTINLMTMLAYVAFETRQALRVSVGIFAAYVGIVAIRLVPEAFAGRLGGEAVDYLSLMVFLGTSVGLLHVMAQVKEQAAEARSTAAAMSALANTDALTGIANRRQLLETLEAQVSQEPAEDSPLAVILLDIDFFKQVNDTYGHDAGDVVLQQVAATLTGAVRINDFVGRWGGEEFLIIAPHTTAEEAAKLAERCRVTLSATTFDGVDQVTASLGVATHRPGDTGWLLLRRADEALYLAKATGRDRVRVYQPSKDLPSRPERATDKPVNPVSVTQES